MKKLLLVLAALSFLLLLSGCAPICANISKEDTDKAQATLHQLQTYYPTIVELLPLIPYVGEPLKIAIPLLVGLTDTTLQALGKLLAENCADQTTLKLAQSTLEQIQALLAKPEIQQQIKQAKIKRLNTLTK